MPRWVGLIGSWALLVLGLGIASVAAAGQWINMQDAQKLRRLAVIDELIAERTKDRVAALEETRNAGAANVGALQNKVSEVDRQIDEAQVSNQVITVSIAENKVYMRRDGQVVFEAVCSTGSGTRLVDQGRTMVFNTPVGKFKILSKEENPQWVPPDWHYIEEARKRGSRVVRLGYGESLDADTGGSASPSSGGGVWSWMGSSGGSNRVMKVKNNTVVISENGVDRELPHGEMIYAGGAVVIPPVGTPQRRFPEVLGTHRLNLGDGYALHGTQQVAQLGRSVSHGCVRLRNEDIARLYEMTKVGDEVVIY